MMVKGFSRTAAALVALLALSAVSACAQTDQSALNQLQTQVETLYARLAPSVVNITNRGVNYDMYNQPVPQEGTGSGFFYDRQGSIVTNFQVVQGAQTLTVTLASGKSFKATVIGTDPANDLAVVRISGGSLPDPIPLGDPSSLKVGQFVLAIGNPFGLQRTLTFGVISALGRTIQSPDNRFIGEAIQTDTAINPGNSGGPLIDLQGNVIGVNSQILSPSGANSGIGFAISASTVKRVVPQLIAHGKYAHPWIGVGAVDLTGDLAQVLKGAGQSVTVDSGVYVAQVIAGGPAERSGIKGGSSLVDLGNTQFPVGGDIITAVNSQKVTTLGDLTTYLDDKTKVGDTANVTLMRDGRTLTIQVQLAQLPSQQQ